MKSIHIFLSACVLFSCNSQRKETEKPSIENSDANKEMPKNCYRYSSATDTISLKVIHNGNEIAGTLVYNFKEKDKNKGTIQGSMYGDMLVADYTFMSEGMQSIRQVAFKFEENSFVEGYGDISIENSKVRFKNLDSLTFNTSMPLTKIDCQ